MKEQGTCGLCGAPHPLEELHPFDGLELCAHCLDQRTLVCRHCGERIWAQDNAGSGEAPLCQACYDDHYTNCCRCGALLHESQAYYAEDDDYDEYPYCSDCFHSLPNASPIHDYYYKPTPVFHGTGPRFFGVELEIDGAGELLHHARSLLEIGNRDEDCLYIKHDGSLDDGLELVTHPTSLDYQLRHVPWAELCRKAVSLGYLSHRANTCGLHVHVSREAFGAESWEQDLAIARVLYFFEKHWEELLKFSRRTPRQLERWAARYGYKEQPMAILDYAKKGCHGGRYTCVNLQNPDTVEFRMFRGTLKANTMLDERDDLYVVKGDNPFCLLQFPRLGLYLYASTEAILRQAVARTWLRWEQAEEVDIGSGDILSINRRGEVQTDHFEMGWTLYPHCRSWGRVSACLPEPRYLEQLKSVAASFGYTAEQIDQLLQEGWSTDEIEDALYGYDYF